MGYALIIKTALTLAKQVQQDHPEIPGSDKFGVMLDLLIGIFGEADVSKYQAAVKVVVSLAVDVWKAGNVFGFIKKSAPAAA